jgi:hypothetical protein
MSAPAARFAPASRRSARLGCMNRSSMATAFRSSRAGARCGSRSATAMIDGVQNVYGLQAAIAQRPHKRTVFESDSLHRWCRPLSASAHATQTAARSVARRSKVHCLQVVATFPNGERLLASRRDRLQAAECSLPLRRVPRLGEGQNDPPGTSHCQTPMDTSAKREWWEGRTTLLPEAGGLRLSSTHPSQIERSSDLVWRASAD